MERKKLTGELTFIPTGSTMLDLALGGGWAANRIFNLVGDKSSGKTLLAIEAFANFAKLRPDGRSHYVEAESAFAEKYAESIGMPPNVERPETLIETVEQFDADIVSNLKLSPPSLYILDSLDSISDDAEMKRDITETNTYGVGKAKKLSELFRKRVRQLADGQCTMGIISQVRENIGVTFGDHYSRSGGKALDFYCTQIVWLSEIEKLKKTVRDQERVVGVWIKAKIKKNKAALPFREVDMKILFGYGIDDEESMISWLEGLKAYTPDESKAARKELVKLRDSLGKGESDPTAITAFSAALKQRCKVEWEMIEEVLRPKVRKYNLGVPAARLGGGL